MILMKKRKSEYKRFIHKVRDRVGKERADMKRLHEKKFREIRMKRTAETKFTLPEGLERYQNAKIFSGDHSGQFVPDEILGPVVGGGNLSLLSIKRWKFWVEVHNPENTQQGTVPYRT